MQAIDYDAATHTYRLKRPGAERSTWPILPSVTQILKAGGKIGDFGGRYPEAAARGSLVHLLCEEIDTFGGTLADEQSVAGYLQAYRAFLADRRIQWTLIEEIVCGPDWAGRLDRVGMVGGVELLVDIKTGSKAPWHKAQLAAYRDGLGEPGLALACLYLKPSGLYKLDVISERDDLQGVLDWNEALSKWRVA